MNTHTSYPQHRRAAVSLRLVGIVAALGLLLVAGVALAAVAFQDINPDVSDNSDPNASTGGRVNGLAADPNNNQVFYAASEFGGLFKTTDGGSNWSRLNGHIPVVMWDVEVDPGNSSRVYATSFYDGRVNPLSGIEVSTDGGATWTHPPTAHPDPALEGTPNDNTPQVGFNCSNANDRTEPSAFGIAMRPGASNNVFVGTQCGVARSTDSGATWEFRDPSAFNGVGNAQAVWDVVVQPASATAPQGIVDICGNEGHFRSTDGGVTYTPSAGVLPGYTTDGLDNDGDGTIDEADEGFLPGGRCSIAVSPDETYVLFVVVGTRVFESDDAGANWTEFANPAPQGRIPFVATNQRSNDGSTNRFSLWFGDVSLFRADCTTPATPAPGGAARCPASGSWSNQQSGAHADAGDVVFDTAVAQDACPRIYSSDGGVHRNTDLGSDCQNPNWTRSNVGLHALWLFAMDGAHQAGDTSEDLYFGNQDTGSFAATNAGAASPTWSNKDCCDVFDVAADSSRVLYTVCCSTSGRRNRLYMRNPGMTGGGEINAYPASGLLPGFRPIDIVDRFADKSYILITATCTPANGIDDDGDGMIDEDDEVRGCPGFGTSPGGVFTTTDITAGPIVWTPLPGSPANACGVQASVSGGAPTFYVQAGICNERTMGNAGDQLWKFTSGAWQRIDTNLPFGSQGVGVFGVDPNNPSRLYASNIRAVANGGPQMVFSADGGQTWQSDPELDNLMTGGGVFKYRTERGPGNFTRFLGYPQPTLVGFDAEDPAMLVAGGRDSGVFFSPNGGQDWGLFTDPVNPASSGIPHLPRPWFAYFDHEPAGTINLYIGTQGRGVWRLVVRLPTASHGGPYVTNEGTDAPLNGSGTDPDGATPRCDWEFDNDGQINDAPDTCNATYDRVGQDGVFPIRLKVTAGRAFTVTATTVTVNNVAPSVSLTSDAPKDEASTVTVSGTVSDPGWLDPLTATIDWGDGTPVEAIAGVLENVRPNATLTFSVSHVYGDNGTFQAEVCGSDDDTTTCETIDLQIDNVDPTAEIDESGAILVNGIPTFIAHAGEPIDFKGRSTDPGSDDLYLSWDWDDGPPSPDVTTVYLVNPPNPDPFPSPSVQPRDVTDMQTHTFADACLYAISFLAEDDDGGNGADTANVIITGNADRARSSGYWQHQYHGNGKLDFDEATLECYLAIVDYVSLVFNESRDASTIEKAYDVLFLKQNGGSAAEQFDRELLTVWLNFANGAIEYDELVDSDGDGVDDTPLYAVVAAAEAVRLDPNATEAEIREQKNILHHLRHTVD